MRLAVERCSDYAQRPCVLLAVDGFLTVRIPQSHRILETFTLAGEKGMSDADKERIGRVYAARDWRALVRGRSASWYAVADQTTEAAAVDAALDACRAVEQECTLHAIGNFRVDERIGPALALAKKSNDPTGRRP